MAGVLDLHLFAASGYSSLIDFGTRLALHPALEYRTEFGRDFKENRSVARAEIGDVSPELSPELMISTN
jgi:hypothetical protein